MQSVLAALLIGCAPKAADTGPTPPEDTPEVETDIPLVETEDTEDTDPSVDAACVSVLLSEAVLLPPTYAYPSADAVVGTPYPVGDLTGDGIGDVLLVGPSKAYDDSSDAFGMSYLLAGPLTGEVDPSAAWVAKIPGQSFGEHNGVQPTAVVSGRFDADSTRDLAIRIDSSVRIFHGPVTGDALEPTSTIPSIADVRAADFNGDGLDDLVVQALDGVQVLLAPFPLGDVDRDAEAFLSVVPECDGCEVSLADVADLTGDGLPDLVLRTTADGSGRSPELYVMPVTAGARTVAGSVHLVVDPPADTLDASALRDWTGDGQPDLVIFREYGATAYILAGPFGAEVSVATEAVATLDLTSLHDYRRVIVGDFDGDALTDVIVADREDDGAAVDAGAAYLFSGGLEGAVGLEAASLRVFGDVAGRGAGLILANVGDLGYDGDEEWMIGSGTDDYNPDRLWVMRGGEVPVGDWYLDSDGDGFGDASDAVSSSCALPGRTLMAGDCDDADPNAFPDARWYPDADGDGFGDPGAPLTACARPAGWSALGTDCDDADATVSPAAPEVCDDGTDQDCDGVDDCARVWADDVRFGSLAGLRPNEEVSEVAWLGDVDGDGFDDVGVNSPSAELGTAEVGAVFVVRGPVVGDHVAERLAVARIDYPSAVFARVGGVGDLSGDGLGDLALYQSSANLVFTDLGAGAAAAPWATFDDTVYVVGGDVDGDGQRDVVGTVASSKQLWVLTSPTSGAHDARVDGVRFWSPDDKTLVLPSSFGDIDGDGVDDIVVGSPTYFRDTGAVFLVTSGVPATGGLLDVADGTLLGPDANSGFGYAFAAADLDGDGADDLVVGAPANEGDRDGWVYVFAGGPVVTSGTTDDAVATLTLTDIADELGSGVRAMGDLDADGAEDVLLEATLGAPSNWFVVHGPVSGAVLLDDMSAPAGRWIDTDSIIRSAASIGDLDGDGVPDLALGAPYADGPEAPDTGAVLLLSGARL